MMRHAVTLAVVAWVWLDGPAARAGWATFIKDLRAATEDGRPIALARRGPSEWTLPADAGRVRLSYEVDTRIATEVAGADQAPFFARFVEGKETLPLEECLGHLGLEMHAQDYAGMVWLASRAKTGAEVRTRRERFLAGR